MTSMNTLTVTLDCDKKVTVPRSSTLLQLLEQTDIQKKRNIVAAVVDNKMRELTMHLENDAHVQFVGVNSLDGIRVYQRSASFILIKAVHDCCPAGSVRILHSLANGLYCEVRNHVEMTPDLIRSIEKRMREIVEADLPFTREEVPLQDAVEIFHKSGRHDKARLLMLRNTPKASIYRLGDQVNYFYGYLAPSTGYIQKFGLLPYDRGFILQLPTITHPEKLVHSRRSRKLYDVFKETLRWREILEVEDVGMLNEVIQAGGFVEFVLIAEAFHEKKIAKIADLITKKKTARIVLLSGPSSSGKTTSTKRLGVQLRVNGLKPQLVSMDDYFLDRDKTPRTANGDHDFESPRALNVELFQDHLRCLIEGKEIELPHYDFKTGKSGMSGRKIKPDENSIVMIEGIHGLNPMFSDSLPRESIFKIYASALTEIPLDSHNRIPTTDTRLLRRLIRDYQFRGYSASQTILRWPSVREGESKHIFPYQENADILFNTALIYELAAIKTMVEPVLKEVTHDSPTYAEALRLLKFLSYFQPIPVEVVPRHSILREFLGGSSFKY